MKVAVVDGQGGGIGKLIVEKLRKAFLDDIEIVALGTNTYATANMVKAGANEGASGESAICYCCKNIKFDSIIGPIGIICPNSMLGELTSTVAETIFNTNCTKYLIPLNKHGLFIPGVGNMKIKDFVDEIIDRLKNNE